MVGKLEKPHHSHNTIISQSTIRGNGTRVRTHAQRDATIPQLYSPSGNRPKMRKMGGNIVDG